MRILLCEGGVCFFQETDEEEGVHITPYELSLESQAGSGVNHPEDWMKQARVTKELTPDQVKVVLETLEEILNAL